MRNCSILGLCLPMVIRGGVGLDWSGSGLGGGLDGSLRLLRMLPVVYGSLQQ